LIAKKTAMGLIQIEGMEFYAFHGCYKEEQIVGNKFRVDISIDTDCEKAKSTDDLRNALNYQAVYLLVKEQMQIKSKLLEHVAGRILDALYRGFPETEKATVKVSKMNPPLGGKVEKVSVTLTK
jgi:7,8-dihydroneopterin aldolase/epimerase/oxygenase